VIGVDRDGIEFGLRDGVDDRIIERMNSFAAVLYMASPTDKDRDEIDNGGGDKLDELEIVLR
jgi:hypothetical protein